MAKLEVLIGGYELAEMLGIQPDTLRQWRKRYVDTFPRPVSYGVRGPRRDSPDWDYDHILAWLTAYKPRLLIGRDIQFPPKVSE